ncbi:MAG: sulfite exporter TauE/SafE family protein [Rhodobacteraceae bacterium]|nr:sulfite exporter TauE/SafE family protein [Paracoccaceae bacterium]
MGQLLAQTLAIPGLIWIIVMTLLAGLVYGFAGFGAALVFMPVVSSIIPVELAVAAFSVSALASLVSLVPRAWKKADRQAVGLMVASATLALPVGIYILRSNDVTTMRWAVLGVTTFTLVALVAGWRYTTKPGLVTRAGVGLGTGLVGGATGLVGPIMVLFQLGGQDNIERSRANTLVFLTATSLLMVPLMAMQGMLGPEAIMLGLLLVVPYGLAAQVGQAFFDPAQQGLYRTIAYGIIALAVLLGLPIYH